MSQDIFQSNKVTPCELNYAQSRFSVDVLIYDYKRDEHTIGWYDYILNKWCFLCREVHTDFYWCYLEEEHRPKPPKNEKSIIN